MKACCLREARANIQKGRDVATCDTCGALILGYDQESDFENMVRSLEQAASPFEHTKLGKLWIVAKPRRNGARFA